MVSPESAFNFINPVLGGTYVFKLSPELKLALFLGLTIPRALKSVDRGPLTTAGLARLRRRWTDVEDVGTALPDEASEYFRAEVLRSTAKAPATSAAAFAVAVVVAGAIIAFAVPQSAVSLPMDVCDASFCGLSIYLQVMVFDPGAKQLVSFTPGLRLDLGSF